MLLTRPDVLLLPKCPCIPQTVAIAFSQPCFPQFTLLFCSFSYSTNIYLVPVVCQTHQRHSGCHHEQDKGPVSGADVPSACSPSSLPPPLLCLPSCFPHPPSALLSHGLWQGLSDFYSSSPFTPVPQCLWLSPASRGKLPPALWPDLWDFEQLAPALAAAISAPTLCSHCLLSRVHPF